MLHFAQRAPAGEPEGLLILHHGRGTDERDLLPLADVFDPQRRLQVITPRAPLPFGPGYRWYENVRVGHPDPPTFHASLDLLAELHDSLWEQYGVPPGRTLLGGFSMGAVMSYAMGLKGERPAPAGILAFSGFIPIVDGWSPALDRRQHLPVLIAHGRNDPVIGVEFGRRARELLGGAGLPVDYRESGASHNIDPGDVPRTVEWIGAVLTPSS